MSFSTQTIRYGWVALASLGVLTGTTIYVANNQRHQVKPQDIIEIALGTYERCLATQTSTNPTYSVTPPSFVRTWTSNVYTTNGVTVYTNIVTNAIGWHIDRDMMVSLDTTIKALVPYYVDPNTVYDGTTNIVMLTVTGLWASLGIGDKTNLFTREPCWTNPVSTNWIVNYTSYWPSTNGTATNICYTSDYRQVVNYAQSWTVTGGHIWATSSNWASEVVTVTNAATYGDYPWQIYAEDLQERYKVLNALKITQVVSGGTVTGRYNVPMFWEQGATWTGAVAQAEGDLETYSPGISTYICFTVGIAMSNTSYFAPYMAWMRDLRIAFPTLEISKLSTNFPFQVSFFFLPTLPYSYLTGTTNGAVFYDNGLGLQLNTWKLTTETNFGVMPAWCNEPGPLTSPLLPDIDGYGTPGYVSSRGFKINTTDQKFIIDWQFNYCTNKYW